MNSNSIKDVRKIVQDLYDEFLKDEKRINEICSNHSVRIDELDHKINNCRKNEDIDFKVFSPRNSSSVDSKKIAEYEKEKESLETENRNFSKQLRYYSEKVKKLEEALSIIDGVEISASSSYQDFIDSVPDKIEEEKIVDPFDELFPSRKKADLSQTEEINEEFIANDEEEVVDTIDEKEESSLDDNSSDENDVIIDSNKYVDVDSLNIILHKSEFTERIVTSDTIRAKLELKEIVKQLKEFIHKYS